MPTNGDLAPISNVEREVTLGKRTWKCRQLTIGDYAQLESYLTYAPKRAGIELTDEQIMKRSIVTCYDELTRLENVIYIFWLSVRHNNIKLEEVQKTIGITDLAELYKITSELSGLGGENPF